MPSVLTMVIIRENPLLLNRLGPCEGPTRVEKETTYGQGRGRPRRGEPTILQFDRLDRPIRAVRYAK